MIDSNEKKSYSCASCGGHMRYTPEYRGLVCESCGQKRSIASTTDKSAVEIPLSTAPDITSDFHSKVCQCESCGGEIVFHGESISKNCPYCNGATTLKSVNGGFAPSGILPFTTPEKGAREQALKWLESRNLMPNDVLEKAMTSRLVGVYAPFWTFDADIRIEYSGKQGRSLGKRTIWTSVSGSLRLDLNDYLMPASDHITCDIRDGTGPWPIKKLVDFNPDYLAGFCAGLHHTGALDARDILKKDISPIFEDEVKRAIAGSRQKISSMEAHFEGETCRAMLLPLWIFHYTHEGEEYRVIASGRTGKCFGTRPICQRKLMISTLIATSFFHACGALLATLHAGI